MRVLVTGAAGFIGSQVVRQLHVAGHEVIGLDAFHPSAHRGTPPAAGAVIDGVPVRCGDLRDRSIVDDAVCGVRAVVHQAAMVGLGVDMADLPEYVGCNDLGTAVLLAAMAAAGVRRLVLASSMVVYGEGGYACPVHGTVRPAPRSPHRLASGRFDPPCPVCGRDLLPVPVDEDAPLCPRSGYAATKVAQEHLASAWAHAVGGSVLALRYHNVYGPGMPRDTPYSGVAAIFRSALERGQPPRVFEDGRQQRDFVHVHDVARANVLAVASIGGTGLSAYNIASGRATTVGEMAAALAAACAGPVPVLTGECRPGDVRHVVASPARAAAGLGFTAQLAFPAGIAAFARAPLRG